MSVAQGHPAWWLIAIGVVVVIGVLYLLMTLVGVPLLALVNRLFSASENNTAESEQSYLLGTVTLTIAANKLGEVMVVGNGRARQTYPARSYDADAVITQGTSVVVIKMSAGVAYVQPVKMPERQSE
ncbi:hypothetical protein [Lacticaseibacillus sp. GG6-2]